MKINTLLIGLLIGVTMSCSTSKVINSTELIGRFYAEYEGFIKGTSMRYYLDLGANNVFYFEIKGHDYSPQCTGKWEQKGNIIFLKCDEEEYIGVLVSTGYMKQRERTIKIQNKDKLKLGKVILRRKKT